MFITSSCQEVSRIFRTKSAIYFSKCNFSSTNPHTTQSSMPEKTYIRVILRPKTPSNIAIAISFTNGDVIKNDSVTPRGIPHLRKPIKSGIDEQVQKGVIAPKKDAKIYSSP